MLQFQRFYNARKVIVGIELAQKIRKRQFELPTKFGSNPVEVWSKVLAAT